MWAHVTSEFPVLFNAAFPNSKKCPIFTLNWEFAGGGLVGGWISLYYLALGKIDLAICKKPVLLSLLGWVMGCFFLGKVFLRAPGRCHAKSRHLDGHCQSEGRNNLPQSSLASRSGVVIRLVCDLLLFNSASGNGTALGHGWGSHAVDCTKVLASTRNHDSLPVAIEWKHFVCLVAVKLEAVQSHAILAGCCKRTPN